LRDMMTVLPKTTGRLKSNENRLQKFIYE
jgi:hypothetical protein